MKMNRRLIALGTAMVALSTLPTRALLAATDALGVAAEILASPLALVATQNLNFGAFTNNGAGGNVTINTTGGGSYVGVTQVGGVVPSQGGVQMIGNSGVNIVFSVTDPTVTVVNTAAASQTMVVDQFNVNTNAGGSTEILNMAGTTAIVPIGARLTVPAGRLPGSYTGTFTVQAVYQ